VPKTPLFKRLEDAGRLINSNDVSRYLGTSGGTNFRPMRMTADELRVGQEALYRRLYTPEAYAARLLGNMHRFSNVKYRPEAVQLSKVATFFRLVKYYWKLGGKARRFFFGIIGRTIRHSPRSTRQVVQFLGMYKHFCEVHGRADSWDPWTAEAAAHAAPPKSETDDSDVSDSLPRLLAGAPTGS